MIYFCSERDRISNGYERALVKMILQEEPVVQVIFSFIMYGLPQERDFSVENMKNVDESCEYLFFRLTGNMGFGLTWSGSFVQY